MKCWITSRERIFPSHRFTCHLRFHLTPSLILKVLSSTMKIVERWTMLGRNAQLEIWRTWPSNFWKQKTKKKNKKSKCLLLLHTKGLNNDNNLNAEIPVNEKQTGMQLRCSFKSCAKRANHYSATVKTFELVKVGLSSKLIKSLLLFCDNFTSKLVFFSTWCVQSFIQRRKNIVIIRSDDDYSSFRIRSICYFTHKPHPLWNRPNLFLFIFPHSSYT